MAKFAFNDSVRIRDVISTRYEGQTGRIIGVKLSRRGKETLNKYRVRFVDGQTIEVWSITILVQAAGVIM